MTNADKKINHEISDWLGDIVALEKHIEEAMDHQIQLDVQDADLKATFQKFHDTVKASMDRAEAYQKEYGSTSGNPVIQKGSELLGKAAGLIDKMRNDSVSKALRDSYTAYNHLTIAYTMLHTTAMAFEDDATMQFAEQGLRTYAGMIQEINHMMPVAVMHDLKRGDHAPVMDTSVVDRCRATIDEVWSTTS